MSALTKVGTLPLLSIAVGAGKTPESMASHPLLSAETRARSKAERAQYSARLKQAIAEVQASLRQVHMADANALHRWWMQEATVKPLLWRATSREMRHALRQLISERCPAALLSADPSAAQTPEGAGILVVFKPKAIRTQLEAFGVRDLRSGVVAANDRFELTVYGPQQEQLRHEHHTPKERGALVAAYALGRFGTQWVERRVSVEHLEIARAESPVPYHAGWRTHALDLIEAQALRTLLRAAEQYLRHHAPTIEQVAGMTLPGTKAHFSGWGGLPLTEVPTGILKGVQQWLTLDRARVLTHPQLAGAIPVILAARQRKRPLAPNPGPAVADTSAASVSSSAPESL